MSLLRPYLSAIFAATLLCCATWASAQSTAEVFKTVYHVSDNAAQARRALNNARNQLDEMPGSKIVIVTNGPGLDLLIEGSKDAQGKTFEAEVAALAGKGVEFRACGNTMQSRNINANQLLAEAKVIRSGVAEVVRMQAKEGFTYVKP